MKTGNQEKNQLNQNLVLWNNQDQWEAFLARPTKKQREKTQITNIRNENEDIVQIPWTLKGIIINIINNTMPLIYNRDEM